MRRAAPEIGHAVHAGLALFHDAEQGGDIEAAVNITKAVITERSGPSTTFQDMHLNQASVIAEDLLRGYVEHWGADVRGLWAPLNQEIEFTVEVGIKTGVWLRGRADNLSSSQGSLWLVDYKTAGKMDPRDLMKYEMDVQLTSYIYGLSKYLSAESEAAGGEPIRIQGAIIDLLVKTKVPQYAREQFTRSDEELEEFEKEFVEYGRRIRSAHDRVDAGEDWKVVFPKNPEHCFRYGTCPMRDLCLKDTPARRQLYVEKDPDYITAAQEELDEKWRAEQQA
jgi:RecB family exonuclease